MTNKNSIIAVTAIVVLGGLAAYFLYMPTPPEQVPVQAPQPPALMMRQIIETPSASTPLPMLDESDDFMLDALSGLINDPSLVKIFISKQIIRNVVATIDNLPRNQAPMEVMPVKPAPGRFIIVGTEESLTISPKNAERYAPYIKIANSLDTKNLINLYVNLYPLFQDAYEDLGYPNHYFNDRLLVAIDNLLATPDVAEPVRVIQPNVYYLYADPALEERSIGQRILMRIGRQNRVVVMNKLTEISQELQLHMREIEVEQASSSLR
jgi:hypothetical protein